MLFRVADIRVPDREVPRAFVESYAALEFFRLDLKNEDFLPVLKKLGSVYLEGDSAVAETRVELQ